MALQTLPPAARDLARQRDRMTRSTRRAVAREWAGMGDRWDASWLTVGPRIVATLALAQREAVAEAGGYVAAVVEQLGVTAPAEVAVNVAPLVGVASDGRPLAGLVRQGLVQAKVASLAGATPRQALAQGGAFLGLVSGLQVVDALRVATGLHGVARNLGYVRMLSGGSCSRCVILAGRWYRWSSGFDRHPGCDCVHVPAPESVAGDMTVDPHAAFSAMTPAQQAKSFGVQGAQAIRDGADPSQVVNARRGAWGLAPAGARLTKAERVALQGGERGALARREVFGQQVFTTTEGTTRRGLAGKARPGRVRLMPESIYSLAGDRDEALRLLRVHGYVR